MRILFRLAVICILICFLFGCNKDTDTNPDPQQTPGELQVWLHRVNWIDKANAYENDFSGFELDVHFDPALQTFLVKHDFADTTKLTFRSWLTGVHYPEKKGLWLDFKNLDENNKDAAFLELLVIRNEFHLTSHTIVVENFNPNNLIKFDTLNFLTSYYIPFFNPETLTQNQEHDYYNYINLFIQQSGISTISGYVQQLGFMQKWFPQMKKLTWYLDSFDESLQDSVIAQTKRDPAVEMILVARNFYKDTFVNPDDPHFK